MLVLRNKITLPTISSSPKPKMESKPTNKPIEKPMVKLVTQKPIPKKAQNTLPPDEYKNEFPPSEIIINDRIKLVCSVKRGGIDGTPMCFINYQTSNDAEPDAKKGISLRIEHLEEFINTLDRIYALCEEKDLFFGLDDTK